jgi:hypothetical protein
MLLKAANGLSDDDSAAAVDPSVPTVERPRKRCATARVETLTERPRPGQKPVLDETGAARLIAEACRSAPTGRQRWTLRLLAERVVPLGVAETCSAETVRRGRKKTCASHGGSSRGSCRTCVAPLWPPGKTSWPCTLIRMLPNGPRGMLMRRVGSCWPRSSRRCPFSRGSHSARPQHTSAGGPAISSSPWRPKQAGGMSAERHDGRNTSLPTGRGLLL